MGAPIHIFISVTLQGHTITMTGTYPHLNLEVSGSGRYRHSAIQFMTLVLRSIVCSLRNHLGPIYQSICQKTQDKSHDTWKVVYRWNASDTGGVSLESFEPKSKLVQEIRQPSLLHSGDGAVQMPTPTKYAGSVGSLSPRPPTGSE